MRIQPILLCAVLLCGNLLSAQPHGDQPPPPEEGMNPEDFYQNPYEDEERVEREVAYRDYYEDTLAHKLSRNSIISEVFQPRIYDELFDTNLPNKQQKGQWSLNLNPKFGDFLRDDYVRMPVGVTYNFSDWFEASTDLVSYFGNPFQSGDRVGISNWLLGMKYSWTDVAKSGYNIAVGAKANMPVFDPPIEITDGYARYEPYVSFSRQLTNHPNWLIFMKVAYQIVRETPFRAKPIQDQPKGRSFLRPGFIYYKGGNFRYSLELEYRTNALEFLNDNEHRARPQPPHPYGFRMENWVLANREVHEFSLYPAITWFPTKKTREGFIIPGNWDVGIQVEIPVVDETGQDLAVSMRIRWYYDYRHFVAKDLPALFNGKGD